MLTKLDKTVFIALLLFGLFNLLFPIGEVSYTNSMYPTLQGGQAIFLSPFLPENLTNYIVVFRSNDINTVHRAISDNGTWIQTKGDNIPEPDFYHVPKSDVTGIVIATFPSCLVFKLIQISFVLALGVPYITYNVLNERRRKTERLSNERNRL